MIQEIKLFGYEQTSVPRPSAGQKSVPRPPVGQKSVPRPPVGQKSQRTSPHAVFLFFMAIAMVSGIVTMFIRWNLQF